MKTINQPKKRKFFIILGAIFCLLLIIQLLEMPIFLRPTENLKEDRLIAIRMFYLGNVYGLSAAFCLVMSVLMFFKALKRTKVDTDA